MEVVSSDMVSLASPTTWLASFIRLSAWLALSAFCFVMDAISSNDDEVSSRDAACSEEPSANCWLAEATWSEAEAYAQSLGGHLVTINDQAEEDWLVSELRPTSYYGFWIGLTDEAEEGTWVWSSGEAVGLSSSR